jgi:hypothetical protein
MIVVEVGDLDDKWHLDAPWIAACRAVVLEIRQLGRQLLGITRILSHAKR